MPAWQNRQPRVQPRKISTLIRSWTVSASGYERGLRVRPLVEVHHGVLADPPRDTGAVRGDPLDPAVRQVGDVVTATARTRRRCAPARHSSPSRPPGEPAPLCALTMSVILSTASSPSPSDAASMKSAIGSGLNAACPPAMTIGWLVVAVGGVQRDAGQVERGEHVGVAELGGEAQPEQVERADRPVRVDGELAAHRWSASGSRGPAIPRTSAPPACRRARSAPRTGSARPGSGSADLVRVGVHQRTTARRPRPSPSPRR